MMGWALIGVIVYMSLTPHPPSIGFRYEDKLDHLFAYGTLMLWFAQLFRAPWTRLQLALAFVAMGVGLEFIQGMTEYREYEVADMAANASGVAIGLLLAFTPAGRSLALLETWLGSAR
jgi:VanZ family protein